jgi:hypothetical protein
MHKDFATSDQKLESFNVSLGITFPGLTLLYNSQAFTIYMSNK